MADHYTEGACIGIGKQSSFATAVSPTTYVEVIEESLRARNPSIPKGTLRTRQARRYVKSKRACDGGFKTPFIYQGNELLFEAALGGVSTANPEAGRYVHTFTPGTIPAAGLSIVVDRGSIGASNKNEVYDSFKLQKLSLVQALEGQLDLSVDGIGRSVAYANTMSPTYAADTLYADWEDITAFTLGGEVIADLTVQLAELNIEVPKAADSYGFGSNVRKRIVNGGMMKVSGKIDLEATSLTLHDAMYALTEQAWNFTWTGPDIGATGDPYKLIIDIHRAVIDEDEFNAKEIGSMKQGINFQAYVHSSNGLLTVAIHNALSAVS